MLSKLSISFAGSKEDNVINYPNSLRSSYYTHSNELVSEVHGELKK